MIKNKMFSEKILKWYIENKRELPWRKTKNIYHIWISEIMLQQTQVNTVIPYYNNWIKKFKNIHSVAKSSEDIILKYWEGLGYYARARNFHKASKIILNDNINLNKITYKKFNDLPGVGDYTSAAVFSIVKKKCLPAIDTNVKRVISRYLALNNQKDNKKINNFLIKNISNLNPGDFNQAIMEIGALLCKPKNPNCLKCPINNNCIAYLKNKVMDYSIKNKILKRPNYKIVVGVIWKNNKIFIAKRKSIGLLGGLWEFPGGKKEKNENNHECLIREILEELNIEIKVLSFIKKIKHTYSHFSIDLNAYHCIYVKGNPKPKTSSEIKLISLNELSKFPFPKANHKIFPFIKNYNQI